MIRQLLGCGKYTIGTGPGRSLLCNTFTFMIAAFLNSRAMAVCAKEEKYAAIDISGHIAMPFTTEGMFRGYIDAKGNMKVMIYKL